jgi:hypothetical protein
MGVMFVRLPLPRPSSRCYEDRRRISDTRPVDDRPSIPLSAAVVPKPLPIGSLQIKLTGHMAAPPQLVGCWLH